MRPRVLVAGGGPVGLAFASAVQGLDVTVLEASQPAAPPEELDVRVYALSPGSRAFLRDIGAWEHLDPARVAMVRRMEVTGDRGARLQFAARPGTALAWIVEAGRLAAALQTQAQSLSHVTLRHGAVAAAFGAEADRAWAELEGGEHLDGDLLVGADGPDSRVRTAVGLAMHEHPYDEVALIANFAAEKAHGDIARQWFRADGVLAWLPLPGSRISIVWSAPREASDALRNLDPRALAIRVREAGDAVLGDLTLISEVRGFPLAKWPALGHVSTFAPTFFSTRGFV